MWYELNYYHEGVNFDVQKTLAISKDVNKIKDFCNKEFQTELIWKYNKEKITAVFGSYRNNTILTIRPIEKLHILE